MPEKIGDYILDYSRQLRCIIWVCSGKYCLELCTLYLGLGGW